MHLKILFLIISIHGTLGSSDEQAGEINAKNLMNSFKIDFDSNDSAQPNKNKFIRTDSNFSGNNNTFNISEDNTWTKRFDLNNDKFKNITSPSCKPDSRIRKDARQMDLEIQNLSRKFFYPESEPILNTKGKPLTYFKDTSSIPIMFRKVIPPRGVSKLPMLRFEFDQDNKKCRCLCKL